MIRIYIFSLPLVFFNIIALQPALSMDSETINTNTISTQNSMNGVTPDTLPPKYSLEKYRKDVWPLDLTLIKEKYPVDRTIKKEWQPKSLLKQNCMIVTGSNFFEFDPNKEVKNFSLFFNAPSKKLSEEKGYFSTLWDRGLMSASLICTNSPYAAADYGLILSVPPELILRTYTSDAVTSGGKLLYQYKSKSPEELEEYLDKYAMNSYAGRTPHLYDMQLDMPIIPLNDLRGITQNNQSHNEIYIAPRGVIKNKQFKMQVIGFFVNTEAMKKEFSPPKGWPKEQSFPGQPKYTNVEKMNKLKKVAADLNLPIVRVDHLEDDIKLLQSGDQINFEQHNISVFNAQFSDQPNEYDILAEQYELQLNEINQLEVIVKHPEAHSPNKPMHQLTEEDIVSLKNQYNDQLQILRTQLQDSLGSQVSVDKLLYYAKTRNEINQLEVMVKHPEAHSPNKPVHQLTQEDIVSLKNQYNGQLQRLKEEAKNFQ